VRSLHSLLKTAFGKRDGLASDGVTLLDPAAGTMTFVARAAHQAVEEFEAKYGSGGREDFIRRHILKNFYAFELMMAPYAVGHLKMSFFLEELGHRLTDVERVPFYLTNALDNEELEQSRMPGLSSLAEESRLAGKVKKQTPILVILGNPPYSFSSANRSPWIHCLINDYKMVDGQEMHEKKIGVIQDDYVKFLRFAQWKIDEAGQGVVGMITNHSYLDSPNFRGMRDNLLQTFDEIYILDLHGNSLRKETCPDGSKDENVFDIRQGVAIAFFIRRGGKKEDDALVRHAHLWGVRQAKYEWLEAHDLEHTDWRELKPTSSFYLFVQRENAGGEQYQAFLPATEIFPESSVGIITRKDRLTIRWNPDETWNTVRRFISLSPELARAGYELGEDTSNWKVESAQKDIRDTGPERNRIIPVLYRPFDIRFTYYTGKSNGFHSRPCRQIMRHMLAGENLALITPKRVEYMGAWQHAFVSSAISDHVAVSLKTIDYHFPLYLYPTADRADLFAHHEPLERQPNLNPILFSALARAYGKEPAPEEIFHYIYAVLYAPAYREKYAEFLRMDFPRVPFTADANLFRELAALGARLTTLHLLTSPELDPPACRFDGEGDSRVGKGRDAGLRYEAGEQRVYINVTQYFAPVTEVVWFYQVGGYQVCQKWLKDRQERRLELDDIRTYCRIVTALGLTLDIQKQLDLLYPDVEKNVVAIPGHTSKVESGIQQSGLCDDVPATRDP